MKVPRFEMSSNLTTSNSNYVSLYAVSRLIAVPGVEAWGYFPSDQFNAVTEGLAWPENMPGMPKNKEYWSSIRASNMPEIPKLWSRLPKMQNLPKKRKYLIANGNWLISWQERLFDSKLHHDILDRGAKRVISSSDIKHSISNSCWHQLLPKGDSGPFLG